MMFRSILSFVALLSLPSMAQHTQTPDLAHYLQQHFEANQDPSQDRMTQTENLSTSLDLDARKENIEWTLDRGANRINCDMLVSQSGQEPHFDYGEAKDLSDGLQHFDLPKRKSEQEYYRNQVNSNTPGLIPSSKQFAAPAAGDFHVSLSSDCFN
ncbi:DNA-directed RNA polymerase subunit beta [Vibrio vulnificus]|uniref:DNA-directed RNA polymerase subunit beta n=1 Tax=Vibrio vulnificus TaxID=672 RepID=UPI000927AA30|nr:DNA-directed RNA polymerase subunit beta [Vibrio vulnificus]EHT4941197.1 DNA-directed RNA polymerase subunit beta [Vibrio vulnificus]EHT4943796.1 DNA-directed RNA polymerase subunit beta [Vibrio vulnificus]ELL0586673.1 DNA-directed RNA polymerase subunit beta [Vibrio vulnificus]ELL0587681.1 DNA-directed RNA polymerase subunit beta [Vibrio vulnificus]MCA0775709.1 DNA-directed RNA polymerase subunit beta [Vibrio vulnificus]